MDVRSCAKRTSHGCPSDVHRIYFRPTMNVQMSRSGRSMDIYWTCCLGFVLRMARSRRLERVPIELKNLCQEITVALLPSLAVPCVLGIDFLTRFGIRLDFTIGEWYFAKTSHNRYRLATKPDQNGISCCGLSELTPEDELEKFLNAIPRPSENPGVTGLTEHQIDVGQNTSVKQRCYLVSPKV